MKKIEINSSSGYTIFKLILSMSGEYYSNIKFEWVHRPIYLPTDEQFISSLKLDCGRFEKDEYEKLYKLFDNGIHGREIKIKSDIAEMVFSIKNEEISLGKKELAVEVCHNSLGTFYLTMIIDPSCVNNIDGTQDNFVS